MTDGWFVPTMPDLNQRNHFVADYLIQNSIWWIEYANLDGVRQDTYVYPDPDMMVRWCREVFEEYPNFNIVGEVMIPNNTVGAAYWQQGSLVNEKADTGLKSVMDFRLREVASKAFHEETSWNTGLQLVFEHLAYDFCYSDINNVMRLLENHDSDRFLLETPSSLDAYKQAVVLLLTIPGIPQLYYGQELLMTGTTKIDFGYIRPDMSGGWKEDALSVFEESGRTAIQQEAFGFMKKLLHWRKGNDVISKGKMKHFMPRNNIYVYERSYNGKSILVVMNGVNKEVDWDLAHYKEVIGNKTDARNVLTDTDVKLGAIIRLQPKEVLMLEL
jgi:glycosidase